jgi:hypothetical protein
MTTKKKHPDLLRENKILNQAKQEVLGFEELLAHFERTVSVLCNLCVRDFMPKSDPKQKKRLKHLKKKRVTLDSL